MFGYNIGHNLMNHTFELCYKGNLLAVFNEIVNKPNLKILIILNVLTILATLSSLKY